MPSDTFAYGRAHPEAEMVSATNIGRGALGQLDAAAFQSVLERTQLMFAVPALRMRMLNNFMDQVDLIAGALADRADRPPDDHELRLFAGSVTGPRIAAGGHSRPNGRKSADRGVAD